MWHGTFGDPTEAVEYDQGTNFRGRFSTLLEHINKRSRISGVESAWQNGTPEVHGGVLRFIATKLVEEFSLKGRCAIRSALAEAAHAKNSWARRRGFSPLQWVLGYERALPGSVLDRPGDLASHSLALAGLEADAATGTTEFTRRLQMRERAHTWWNAMLREVMAPRLVWTDCTNIAKKKQVEDHTPMSI